MGGLFGVISKESCIKDLFYGVDYHSHLGTEIGGVAVLNEKLSEPIFHDISNSQFKTEFEEDFEGLEGSSGIGVISDIKDDEQPIKFKSRLGTYALCTSGLVRNADELLSELVEEGTAFKVSTGGTNQTELVGELINKGDDFVSGIEKMYSKIEGTISLLLLSEDERSIYASGDVFPLVVGKREDSWAIASETSAFPNLGYKIFRYPRTREVLSINEAGIGKVEEGEEDVKFCPFKNVYYGFPTSSYYGANSEITRERCGGFLAEKDDVKADLVLGIADSGVPHATGYVKRKIEIAKEGSKALLEQFKQGKMTLEEFESDLMDVNGDIPPLRRPVLKYTPGWGRSYIPPTQERRDEIAEYKQIPNPQMIEDKIIVLVDDSIRRGTQLRRLAGRKLWPYQPKEIHGRIASPPQLFPCITDLSTKIYDLAAREAIAEIEGKEVEDVSEYLDESSEKYKLMVDKIREKIGLTTLKYISLDDMVKAVVETPGNIALKRENLCLYCWTGET